MKGSVLGGLGFTGIISMLGTMVGVPWGALLAVVLAGMLLTTVVALAQLAMPQDSADKTQLWDTVLKYRARRQAPAVPATQPPLPTAADS